MKNKLLVVCGPTATGKTRLALRLAKEFNGQIVSADSRQVYRGMDIGTGKDLPTSAQLKTKAFISRYYDIKGIKVWGYDLVTPKKEFSVAHHIRFAQKTIKSIWKAGELPILVGGTGLYIRGVVDGIQTANVPRNASLRKSYLSKSTTDLFAILAQFDATKAASLNFSDKNNPRRLIRAIEIATFRPRKRVNALHIDDLLMLGLATGKTELDKIIANRVEARIKKGFVVEVKGLLAQGVKWKHQAMQALGYKQIKKYLDNQLSLKDFTDDWKAQERQYAKRQMVWFKKDKRIKWLDISDNNYQNKAQEAVANWI